MAFQFNTLLLSPNSLRLGVGAQQDSTKKRWQCQSQLPIGKRELGCTQTVCPTRTLKINRNLDRNGLLDG